MDLDALINAGLKSMQVSQARRAIVEFENTTGIGVVLVPKTKAETKDK